MAEKKQFDEFLGGSEKLPPDAHIAKIVTSRANEIAAMTYTLEHPQQTKLIFQKLPIHMRRRVMSHNAKRMPRKLRNGHISQMTKSGLPPKTKRPSRKYRRRPQNLLKEYSRRQRNKFWLETHIWHAKRFKMIEKWGFKLPEHSNDRCFRANYRALTSHCLLQDISYYTCIEIEGPINMLIEKLKMHCNPNELTFGAKAFINGDREGTVMFYKKNSFPYHPIGHVYFLWKFGESDTKALWIWVHPAFYSEILKEIKSNFNFVLEETNNIEMESDASQELMKSQDKEDVSLEFRIFLTNQIPIYNNTDGCQLRILRNCLNRFRLCGPLTFSILTDAFKLPKLNSIDSVETIETCIDMDMKEEIIEENGLENRKNECPMDVDENERQSIDTWFKTYYQSQNNLEAFEVQKEMYNKISNLTSPNQLPPNMVLSLSILDPRFFLPHKRTKSTPNTELDEVIPIIPTLSNRSPLWDSNIRNYVSKNCISATAIHKLRSQNLVPGIANDEFYNEESMHKVPILLIQKPGNYEHNNSIGFGSGVDIVLPAGWSMPFWLSLILRCARPAGLRESKSIAYENSNLNVPVIHHPDTEAYEIESNFEKTQLTEKYFRFPPNKRANYVKFGITSPFFCEWKILMKEWNNVDNFYVLRDHQILSDLKLKMYLCLKKKRKSKSKEIGENHLLKDLETLIENKNCLVPIKVIIQRKGLPEDFSIICIPTEEDLIKYKEDKKWSGPLESLKVDSNEEKRKNLRKNHLATLKRLRKQRIRAKNKMENASCNIPVNTSSDSAHLNKIRKLVKEKLTDINKTMIDQQAQTMANLYLPKCTNVRHSCDREVIGYVTQGGFSFSEAKGVGLGYIVYSSFLNLLEKNSNIVLIRNTTTRKYRFCKLEILS